MLYLNILTLFLFGSVSVEASNSCDNLHRVALKLNVHALNLTNYNTTRTPSGGPYQKRSLVCNRKGCQVKVKRDTLLRYQPGHPDANENGYVKYPHIVRDSEWKQFNQAVVRLRSLAKNNVCQLSATEGLQRLNVSYHANSLVKRDIFHFEKNGKVHSWSRLFKDGRETNLEFDANGAVLHTRADDESANDSPEK